MSSRMNSPFIETDPIQNSCHQNRRQNQPNEPNFIDLADHAMAKSDKEILDQVQKQNPSDDP